MSIIQDIVVFMIAVGVVLWTAWYARAVQLVTKHYAAGQRYATQPVERLEPER